MQSLYHLSVLSVCRNKSISNSTISMCLKNIRRRFFLMTCCSGRLPKRVGPNDFVVVQYTKQCKFSLSFTADVQSSLQDTFHFLCWNALFFKIHIYIYINLLLLFFAVLNCLNVSHTLTTYSHEPAQIFYFIFLLLK